MRVALLVAVVIVGASGCDKPTGTVPTPATAPAAHPATDSATGSTSRPPPASVEVLFFRDDGACVAKQVDARDLAAADAVLRPVVAGAFAPPDRHPRVVRWLIDDTRPFGSPKTYTANGNEWMTAGTVHSYREYRVVGPQAGSPALRLLQARHGRNDEWVDWAGVPDTETGIGRAMECLVDDLKAVRDLNVGGR